MAAAIESDNTRHREKNTDNARSIFCKRPIKKNNYRLEIDDETPQEIRRQRLLQFQKKCRSDTFNATRGLVEEAIQSDNECDESMEIEDDNRWRKQSFKRNKLYANCVMLSEWMLEVPQDFVDKWIMIPCPQGTRSLVVACKGKTYAYNRRGFRLGVFQSALPGGSVEDNRGSCTIIDCIWMKEQRTYFVLDVLAWSNQPFLNCDTEFRFYWLRTHMEEIKELHDRDTHKNKFPILLLPNVFCNTDLALAMEQLSDFPPLDGLLFYHKEGHYTKGRTPLVTWLKSFMLPEVLGICVPPPYNEKPDGYIDFSHYICSEAEKKKARKSTEETMELVDNM